LITTKLGNDPYYEGRRQQKLAYVIVSAVIDKYSKDHEMKITKRDLRKIIGHSLTSLEYTSEDAKNEWINFRQRIFEIYDGLKVD
jgi:hypothetical protein